MFASLGPKQHAALTLVSPEGCMFDAVRYVCNLCMAAQPTYIRELKYHGYIEYLD